MTDGKYNSLDVVVPDALELHMFEKSKRERAEELKWITSATRLSRPAFVEKIKQHMENMLHHRKRVHRHDHRSTWCVGRRTKMAKIETQNRCAPDSSQHTSTRAKRVKEFERSAVSQTLDDKIMRQRALDTARELRALRCNLRTAEVRSILQSMLTPDQQLTQDTGINSSHSQYIPPERSRELHTLRRSTRVSQLLNATAFRQGLENLMHAPQPSGPQARIRAVQPRNSLSAQHVVPSQNEEQVRSQVEFSSGARPDDRPHTQSVRERLIGSNLSMTPENPFSLLFNTVRDELNEIDHLHQVSGILSNVQFRESLESLIDSRVQQLPDHSRLNSSDTISSLRQRQSRHRQGSQQPRSTRIHDRSMTDELAQHICEIRKYARVSYDLQLDIQRAIRMEVAAAIGHVQHEPDGLPGRSVSKSNNSCIICLEKTRDTLLYGCGHYCLCNTCARELKMNNSSCPVCRARIKDIVRVYDA